MPISWPTHLKNHRSCNVYGPNTPLNCYDTLQRFAMLSCCPRLPRPKLKMPTKDLRWWWAQCFRAGVGSWDLKDPHGATKALFSIHVKLSCKQNMPLGIVKINRHVQCMNHIFVFGSARPGPWAWFNLYAVCPIHAWTSAWVAGREKNVFIDSKRDILACPTGSRE